MAYHIDEENSDISFIVNGDKVVLKVTKVPAGTGGGSSDIYLIKVGDATIPTDLNTYSALRVLAEIEKAVGKLDDKYLRKDIADTLQKGVRSLGDINIGENVMDSLLAGVGTLISDKRIQTPRIEVRDSLTVLKMIINEIQAMRNDFLFTDVGIVSKVEDLGESTYRLTIEKRTDADITSIKEGHVIKQIVNDILLGGKTFYTSWMRVLSANTNTNTITVVLYPDSECPGGVNNIPAVDYAVARQGTDKINTDGEFNPDSAFWSLSSREGAIRFFQNVFKPILEDYNYALSLGYFPEVDAIKHLPLTKNDIGLLAKTIVAEKIYEFDWNGHIVCKNVKRGEWRLAVAQSNLPYRYVTTKEVSENGTKYHDLEQHTVEHLGFEWACLIDKTQLEPKWNSTAWRAMNQTKGDYTIKFTSSDELAGFDEVDCVVTARVFFGQIDITDELLGNSAFQMWWTRNTDNAPDDNAWLPVLVDEQVNVVSFVTEDMGRNWSTRRKAQFTCWAFIPAGDDLIPIDNTIPIIQG